MDVMDGGLGIALQRRLGLLVNPSPGISPELQATLDFGPMPELLLHLGWHRYSTGGGTGAVAAQNSATRFRNPVTSGMLVIVEGFAVSAAASQEFVFNSIQTADLGTTNATAFSKDTRDLKLPASVVTQGSFAGGLHPSEAIWVSPPGYGPAPPIWPIIVAPGQLLEIFLNTVNIAFDFTWWWRERRQITPAELVP